MRHVVGETEGRGAITFSYVCENYKLFPVEDFLWWVSTNHGERRKKNSMSGWWCQAGNRTTGESRIVYSHCRLATQHMTKWFFRRTEHLMVNMTRALKLVTNLIKGNKLGVVLKSLAEREQEQTCGGVRIVHFGGQCKNGVCWRSKRCTKLFCQISTRQFMKTRK